MSSVKIWLVALCLLAAPLRAAETGAEEESKPEKLQETLVVTATKQERRLEELPVSATVVTAEQLKFKAATIPGDELTGVPGVFFRRSEPADSFMAINIRGLTGNHGNDTFLALLDGIPFVSAHEEVLLAELPHGSVDRVEVVRGPVSALYGRGALSGAVNYITKSPTRDKSFQVNLSGGSFGFIRPHISATLPIEPDTHRLMIDAYFEESDGWRDVTARRGANILLKDEVIFSERFQMTAYLNYYENQQEAGGQIPIGPDGNVLETAGGRTGFVGFEPNEYDRETLMTALRFTNQLGEGLSLQTTLHYRQIEDNNLLNFFDPFGFDPDNEILRVNGFENDRATDVFFIEPQLTWTTQNNTLIVGANFEQVDLEETDWWTGQFGFNEETFEFHFYEINIDYTTGEILNLDHPLFVTRDETYRADSSNQFTSLYFQNEWSITERTSLTIGARYDRFEREADIDSDVDFDGVIDDNPLIVDDENHISPKLAIMHRWSPGFNTWLSYGEGFNSNFGAVWQWDPSLYQRGTEVKPSIVQNLELGFRGTLQNKFNYSVSLFNLVQDDRLVFISNQFGTLQATTADEFESNGLELETAFRFNSTWSGYLNYTYTDAEWNDYSVGGVDYSGNAPVGVPENMLSFGINGEPMENLTLRAWYDAYDDYFFTLGNEFEDGGWQLVNLAVSYELPQIGGKITATGKNILDEDYHYLFGSQLPLTAQPGLPAQFMLGMTFDF